MTLDYNVCDWPTLEEFRRVVDVDPDSNRWDETMGRQLAAAIQQVKDDVGDWDEMLSLPDCNLAAAALRAAIVLSSNDPNPEKTLQADAIYMAHLKGHRRRFSFS